mmetsp:Transcript_11990/g.18469  ORF Transcript_11990/g.18469 Transcript_11990/m.18469 type:complete len:375 (+) Transcript_11990:195-1319(+)
MTRKMSKSFIFICFLVSILHCRGEPESSKTPALRRRLGFTDPRTITMRPVNAEQFNKNPAQLEDSSSLFSLSTQQQQVSATSVLSPMQQQQAQVSQSTQQQVSAPSLSSSSMLQQAQINQSEQQKAPEHNTLSDGSTENTPRKKLEFIHITKTGGSAIEAAAAKEGIMWGACHYTEVPSVGCKRPDWTKSKKGRFDGVRKYVGEPWHAPARWLNPNHMESSDTFVVIRDPYDRTISEYYCSSFGYKGDNPEDSKVFNTWLAEQLEVIKNSEKVPGHMLPQRYFVYDQNGDRVVSHILRYETLKHDFDALMEYYDLPMRMPDKTAETVNYVESINESTKRMTRNDISPENLKQINQIYANDFQYFDYPMMQTNRT